MFFLKSFLCVDDLATDVDGEEDKERRVVINMVVEEDDGRCKVLLASGLWSILPYHFYVGAGTAAVRNLRGIEKSESHQLPVCLTSGMKP